MWLQFKSACIKVPNVKSMVCRQSAVDIARINNSWRSDSILDILDCFENFKHTRMPTLLELAAQYKTDKLEHGYIDFYEQHLPKSPKKILEIGVKEGRSIQMWQKYFPEAEIHGLDLFMEFPVPSIPGVKFWQGNQIDYKILEQLRNEDFDCIIDDGSHNSRDQMMTFFGLFNGKHYFIEDLYDDDFWRDNLPKEMTAKHLFDNDSVYNKEFGVDNKIIMIYAD